MPKFIFLMFFMTLYLCCPEPSKYVQNKVRNLKDDQRSQAWFVVKNLFPVNCRRVLSNSHKDFYSLSKEQQEELSGWVNYIMSKFKVSEKEAWLFLYQEATVENPGLRVNLKEDIYRGVSGD